MLERSVREGESFSFFCHALLSFTLSLIFVGRTAVDRNSDLSSLPILVQRFLGYTQIVTTADEQSETNPSSEGQREFAEALVKELQSFGVEDVRLTPEGIVMATIPATAGCETSPAMGLIAHMDTSPDAVGGPVNWRITRYQGNDIVLNAEHEIMLSPNRFPELNRYIGQDIIVTDGTTLLGADDKAGVAIVMSVVETLMKNPRIPHAKLCIAFTPDEEISRGTDHFDLKAFGADYAYTIDGGELGELDSETFNAAIARVTFNGLSVHPGYAKGKMINAAMMLNDFLKALPRDETPERTEGYEGYYHLIRMEGTVERASAILLIRDHDRDAFEVRKSRLAARAEDYNRGSRHVVDVKIKDQYYNMKDKLKETPVVLSIARAAMESVGVMPVEKPIRGGTDGARLTQMGLPCPNIFTGGMNYHGIYECLPIPSFIKAYEVVLEVASRSARVKSL